MAMSPEARPRLGDASIPSARRTLRLLAATLIWVGLPCLGGLHASTGSATPSNQAALAGPAPRTAGGWIPEQEDVLRALRREPPRRVTVDEPVSDYWRENLFRRVFEDQKFLFTTWAPQEARRPSFYFPLIAGVATATTSSRANPGPDFRLSQSISDWGLAHGQGTARAFSFLGDGAPALALVGGSYLVGRWRGNTRLSRASSLSAEAMANAAIWSTTLKELARRARPSEAVGGEFLVADSSVSATSFPSGHAMGAFAVATVIAGEYRDKRWVPWVAYGTAGLIGTSRVALGRHYVSDVLVGGLLGRSLGRMVLARQRGAELESILDRFEPIVDPGGRRYGLSYHRSW